MNNGQKEKGITLIALAVTIIVMLILAGVTITTLTGEHGIIKMAQEAKNKKDTAEKKEEKNLDEMEKVMDGIMADIEEPERAEIAKGFKEGRGTEKNPYIIENAEQLKYFASLVNAGEKFEGKYVSITQTIDLENNEFIPIGLGSIGNRKETEWNMENSFDGILEGNGNVITGVKITQEEAHGVGIIGVLGENGVVKNLNTENGTIIGRTCVGGIVGASKGQIINCTNKLTIIAQDNANVNNSGQQAGGIVGFATMGIIDNCKNYGEIITKDDSLKTLRGKYAGGIVGDAYLEKDLTISNCINSGIVTTVYQQAGGIIASTEYSTNKLTIKKCKNLGTIKSEINNLGLGNCLVGGIIGWGTTELEIEDCHNFGEIITDYTAGGIAGKIEKGTITGCSNVGNVMASNDVGGIVGWQKVGTITGCSNGGEVTTNNYQAGGIVGRLETGKIIECSNNGIIIANKSNAGGIIGSNQEGIVENCSNSGEIISKDHQAGGITRSIRGWNNNRMQ